MDSTEHVEAGALGSREIDTGGQSLRRFTAHGVLVNSFFDVGLGGLNLLRGVVLAIILTRADFGLWEILAVSLGVVAQLKLVGIADKYIQQNDADQELAFQRAFTFDLIGSLATMVLLVALVPVMAAVYGRWRLLAPGFVLCTMMIAYSLQSPVWIFYRRMDFVRQRLLTAVEPAVGLVVAVGLALAGLGFWSLVIGAAAGAWSGAIVAVLRSPYRLVWRLDRRTARVYWTFSGPILVASVCNIFMANGAVLATFLHLGVAAVGAVSLATTLISFTTSVDDVIATTVYPGICAVADRVELLRESFTKTNRLAMLWAIPFGVGLTLFAPELIHYVLGRKWAPAVSMIQITGLVAALNHVGFNWDDYYRARGDTRPLAVVAVAAMVVTLGTGIPLLLEDGLTGLAWGIGLGALAAFIVRTAYLARLFHGLNLLLHSWRAVTPVVPAVALVLGLRALTHEDLTAAIVELILYLLVVAGTSAVSERALVLEAAGYLRRRPRSRTLNATD